MHIPVKQIQETYSKKQSVGLSEVIALIDSCMERRDTYKVQAVIEHFLGDRNVEEICLG